MRGISSLCFLAVIAVQGFLVGFFWVEGGDESRFAEKEAQSFDLLKLCGKGLVGVDGEIRRNDG
jgi:hypothetical protein